MAMCKRIERVYRDVRPHLRLLSGKVVQNSASIDAQCRINTEILMILIDAV